MWKDILQKAPFGMGKKNNASKGMDSFRAGQGEQRATQIHGVLNEILRIFKDDPDFKRVGQFGIKVLSKDVTGTGTKRDLMYDMNSFGMDIDEIITEATSYLGKLGFTVESQQGSNRILVKK